MKLTVSRPPPWGYSTALQVSPQAVALVADPGWRRPIGALPAVAVPVDHLERAAGAERQRVRGGVRCAPPDGGAAVIARQLPLHFARPSRPRRRSPPSAPWAPTAATSAGPAAPAGPAATEVALGVPAAAEAAAVAEAATAMAAAAAAAAAGSIRHMSHRRWGMRGSTRSCLACSG